MIVKLVLEIIDPNTGCRARSFAIEPTDPSVISFLLGEEEFDPRHTYELDAHDTARVLSHFGFLNEEPISSILRPHHRIDDLPYRVHTNRELALMLDGVKPLAVFGEEYPLLAGNSLIPEWLFDKHVATGRFVKREFVGALVHRDHRIRHVLYARPDEAWRIEAYILLWHTQEVTGWNEALERMEGSLLGYEEWQTDAHILATRARMAARRQNTSD